MGNKRKTRFIIRVADKPREVLSIRETPHGDLVILLRRTQEMSFHGKIGSINEHRYSAHPSKDTEGYTFTQRISFDDGTTADSYTHAIPADNKFAYPLFYKLQPDMSKDHYIPELRSNDTIIDIGSYEPNTSVLGLVAVVCDKHTNFEKSIETHLCIYRAEFTVFDFYLIRYFMPLISTHIGRSLLQTSHFPRINRKSVSDIPLDESQSYFVASPHHLIVDLYDMIFRLNNDYIDATIAWQHSEGYDLGEERINAMREFGRFFLRDPYRPGHEIR